jgi:hypothetical protein
VTGSFAAAALARRDGSAADGIHLLWTAPPGTGYSLDGWDIRRRDASGRPKVACRALSGPELEVLHRVLRLHTDVADFSVRQVPGPPAPPGSTQPPPYPIAYGIRLPQPRRVVEVHAGVPAALAIALRAGKAVAVRILTGPSGTQSVRFSDLGADEVQLYTTRPVSALELCLDIAPDPDKEEAEWANAKLIAEHLQIPVRALDPALTTAGDEEALAKSRLIDGEDFDVGAFDSAAELLNAAATGAPQCATTITKEEPGDPFVELRSWSYALALLVNPAWRRMLGFGLLDRADGLIQGNAYDYRITGRFHRREMDERLHGFHTVPRGTTLPETFTLGAVSLRTPLPAVVDLRPAPAPDALTATGRKGIALDGDPGLTLSFPSAVQRVTLELDDGAALTYRATTSEFLPGLPLHTFTGALPAGGRVTIETPDPVDTIELAGLGFLFGVCEDPGPDDVVTRSVVLSGVVFDDTPPPDAPAALDTDNLQEPVLPGVPAQPPAPLGFTLRWTPPPAAGTPAGLPWPPDLGAFPPFDALSFLLERRGMDTGGAFAPLDTLVFGSRGSRGDPPALRPGIDLEAAFPEDAPPQPPVPAFMSFDDTLADAPPSSEHQYRIASVDAIGRRSPTPTEGAVVRLEKHRAPPPPAAVRASVLQQDDPELSAADRALLGASANAIVLEWSWTDRERGQDRLATEFRVYWQPLPLDVVQGAVTGPPAVAGPLLEVPAQLDRPLEADAMRGRYLTLADYPFKVAAHTAGQTITIQLEPSALDSSLLPAPAAFEFRPVLTGAEQRPPAWAERTAVVPITADEQYRHVFRDVLTLNADHPHARVWTGVSAADDQSYVPDAFPGGGRSGNESAVTAAPAAARYLGRPVFTVPPPLPDVPELVTAEPAGDAVKVAFDLAALLPAAPVPPGHLVQLERIALGAVVSCVGANADGTIRADLPDGTTASYTLGNPGDQATLHAQIRTGTPARVEGRFLVDFLLRFATALEPMWHAALPAPVAFGAVTDTLPRDAERHVHRVRLVDPASHASAGTAIVPQIVRVPSLRSPGPPELKAPSSRTATLDVEARVRDAFDLTHVLLFTDDQDSLPPPDDTTRIAAQLLRLPNRRDLYPSDGIRLRLADGTVLAPAAILEAASGAADPPDRVLTVTLAPGPGRRVAVWGVALTRDGVPSRLTGPVVALTAGGP